MTEYEKINIILVNQRNSHLRKLTPVKPNENVKKLYGVFNIESEERRKPKITKRGQKREKTRWSDKDGGRLESISRKSNFISDFKSTLSDILILYTI